MFTPPSWAPTRRPGRRPRRRARPGPGGPVDRARQVREGRADGRPRPRPAPPARRTARPPARRGRGWWWRRGRRAATGAASAMSDTLSDHARRRPCSALTRSGGRAAASAVAGGEHPDQHGPHLLDLGAANGAGPARLEIGVDRLDGREQVGPWRSARPAAGGRRRHRRSGSRSRCGHGVDELGGRLLGHAHEPGQRGGAGGAVAGREQDEPVGGSDVVPPRWRSRSCRPSIRSR